MEQNVSGKVIVITGASSGIGAATARKLGKLGAKVVLAARREEQLAALVKDIGGNALAVRTDVSKRADVAHLISTAIAQFGRVDVLWNNAGVMPLSFFDEDKTADWDRMIDVNIKGVLYGINAVLPHMLERGDGHILTTSSVNGYKTLPATGVYSGTKFAVRAIMDTLREEVAGKVRVTTIYPGLTATEFGNEMPSERVQQAMGDLSKYPMMDADAVADAVVFAISQSGNAVANDITLRALGQSF